MVSEPLVYTVRVNTIHMRRNGFPYQIFKYSKIPIRRNQLLPLIIICQLFNSYINIQHSHNTTHQFYILNTFQINHL